MSGAAATPSQFEVVLGYSGLHRASTGDGSDPADLSFRQGRDSAAALVIGGELIAAVQQERFSRKKFDGDFPCQAIAWCLEHAGVDPSDIQCVAHGFDYRGYDLLSRNSPLSAELYHGVYDPAIQVRLIREHLPSLGAKAQVSPVRHHVAHAHAALAAADYDSASVLVADGMGEFEAISIYRWQQGELIPLRSLGPQSSLGLFYSLITRHLGFTSEGDEYKVMGLAPYGDAARHAAAMEQAVELTRRGVRVPILDWREGGPRYAGASAWLTERFGPERQPQASLTDDHSDIAAAAQQCLTSALAHLAQIAIELAGHPRLVLTGGVALNCSAVGALARNCTGLREVYVPPAPGDEGTAVGAAMASSKAVSRRWPCVPLLGPLPGPARWGRGADIQVPMESMALLVAELLARQAVVGWVQGRLELGPRALGNRSILGSPSSVELRDEVNRLVKDRESFRPLAPAVLAEHASDWFQTTDELNLRHMTSTVQVRPEKRALIEGVVHVDGTARIQAVHRSEHPLFWGLIDAFRERVGVPMLLNTSLNLRGEPIVRTAEEALALFERTKLDAMVIGDRLWLADRWGDILDRALATGAG